MGALKIAETAQISEKPVLGCFMGVKGVAKGIEELQKQRIPAFPFPESAAKTLSVMVKYSEWLNSKKGTIPSIKINKEPVKETSMPYKDFMNKIRYWDNLTAEGAIFLLTPNPS